MRAALVVYFIQALASATAAAAVGRVVGGQETSISQFPFMANILHSYDASFFMPACAGAILNFRTILTTASCWPYLLSRTRVRVGSSNATSGGTVLNINQVARLGSYNPVTLENDVAVMRTVEGITFVPKAVMPVGIASATTVVPDNSLVTIAGWGRTEVSLHSEQLRYTQVRTISNRECEHQHFDIFINIPNSMMCTIGCGFPVPDACVGDNGSPLVFDNVVVGLVTHPRCGNTRPSVHTRVSSYSSFIQQYMNIWSSET